MSAFLPPALGIFGLEKQYFPEFESVPSTFPVRPLADDDPATDRVKCGTCNRSWDDAIATQWTPVPAGRCPFEYFHEGE